MRANKLERYRMLSRDWSDYLRRNKNRHFYLDRLLGKLLDKHDLTLEEYYEFNQKEKEVKKGEKISAITNCRNLYRKLCGYARPHGRHIV